MTREEQRPTPEEIRAECEAIQAEWDRVTRRGRQCGGGLIHWTAAGPVDDATNAFWMRHQEAVDARDSE